MPSTFQFSNFWEDFRQEYNNYYIGLFTTTWLKLFLFKEVLIAKRKLFQNETPNGQGGGTVQFVTKKDHGFIKHIEEREEGGTPAIVNNIRIGLVMNFKRKLDKSRSIMAAEERNLK
mgnify:CR=1 FL=1